MSELNEKNTLPYESDVKKLYKEKLEELEIAEKRWRRLFLPSQIVRGIATIVTIVSSVVSWYIAWDKGIAWYMIALNIVCALSASFLIFGCIILILKPVFYIFRRTAKKKTYKVLELRMILKHLESEYLSKNATQIRAERANLYDDIKNEDVFDAVTYWIDEYYQTVENYYNCFVQSEEWTISNSIYSEWQWVSAAATVIIVAVGLLVAYINLMIMAALAVCFAAIFVVRVRNGEYNNPAYHRYHFKEWKTNTEEYIPQDESLWAKTIGRPFEEGFLMFSFLDDTYYSKMRKNRFVKQKKKIHKKLNIHGNYNLDIQSL